MSLPDDYRFQSFCKNLVEFTQDGHRWINVNREKTGLSKTRMNRFLRYLEETGMVWIKREGVQAYTRYEGANLNPQFVRLIAVRMMPSKVKIPSYHLEIPNIIITSNYFK
ncbi:hypothetical protein [Ileibacterium valens]|uniref:hypothetical protein n=1 Tax=Ileibacterium valens TaxID=1862668 RepID=UPI00272FDC34|nr:hypothetical protein [Ileibacterium valens]